jgi:hypothetical protein
LSTPKASSRTQRACTPACSPSLSTCSPEYASRRPPHCCCRRAPPSARSPSQLTISAHPLGPSEAALPHIDQLRPCPCRNSSARGRATTGPSPPLAGDTPGQATTANRERASPIAYPPRLFACRASPRRWRARHCRRVQGRGRQGNGCEGFKTSRGASVKRFYTPFMCWLKLVKCL